jgi:hypothetical protein
MTSEASPVVLPTLVVTGGSRDGHELVLEALSAEKVLGSGPSCHLRLEAPNVDVVHAQVSWEAQGILLTDVGSQAGTYVNGERIGDEHPLQDGDRVTLGPPGSSGSVKLLVFIPQALPQAAAAPPPAGGEPLLDLGDTGPTFGGEAEAFVLAEDEPDTPAFSVAAAPSPAIEPPPRAPVTPPSRSATPAIILDEPAVETASTPASAGVPHIPPPPVVPPARKPTRPEYTNELPSIGVEDRVREAPSLPAPAVPLPARATPKTAKVAAPRMQIPEIPRVVWLGLGAAVLVGGAFAAYAFLTKPPPVITGVSPSKTEAGEAVTITGEGFASDPAGNTVRFGDAAGQVRTATENQLTATVPDGLTPTGSVDVQVTVEARGDRSNALFVKVARLPRPLTLEPDVALPGAELTVKGHNLDLKPMTVLVGGAPADVRRATPTSLQILVPALTMAEGTSVPVSFSYGVESVKSLSLVLGRLPMVMTVNPPRGPVGQRVVLQGRGFDPAPAGNVVTLGGLRALVFSASPTELQVAAPAPPGVASQVSMPVVVQARGSTSAAQLSYVALHPSGTLFRPRFLPALVGDLGPERHVYVSTQLGPMLVLTGAGGAASVAERAAAVAAKLNDLMDAAGSGRPVVLEMRDGASPAVAVSGGDVVVTATAEDPEGYAREAGAKGGRATPRQLALHWTALLQDYLSLFGQRQRPFHMMEMTPGAKVLTEMYAEAERRGAGNGVPTTLVNPLSPVWAKSLRDLALVLPAGTGTNPGAAVAGRWVGTMEEPAGQRGIEVLIRVDGKGLAGTVTTKSGQLAMGVPLQDVGYDKGQVRFRLTSGGVTRSFRGALEGAILTGTIHQGTSGGDAIGRFTLKFVE